MNSNDQLVVEGASQSRILTDGGDISCVQRFICIHCMYPCSTLYTYKSSTTTASSFVQTDATSSTSIAANKSNASSLKQQHEESENTNTLKSKRSNMFAKKSSSTKNSCQNIQLSICSNCNAIVDKYCEYDLILLLLDTIALRRMAYRHVLFNYNSTNSAMSSLNTTVSKVLQSICTIAILRTHIICITTQDKVGSSLQQTMHAIQQLIHIFTLSVIGYCIQYTILIASVYTFIRLLQRTSSTASSKKVILNVRCAVVEVLLHAIILPAIGGQILTSIVMSWEISNTVLILGNCCIVYCYQCIAVYTVIETYQRIATADIEKKRIKLSRRSSSKNKNTSRKERMSSEPSKSSRQQYGTANVSLSIVIIVLVLCCIMILAVVAGTVTMNWIWNTTYFGFGSTTAFEKSSPSTAMVPCMVPYLKLQQFDHSVQLESRRNTTTADSWYRDSSFMINALCFA